MKDIATRVVARELNLDETPVSKVMTRNPVFVLSDTLAVEALQKMVQGSYRHYIYIYMFVMRYTRAVCTFMMSFTYNVGVGGQESLDIYLSLKTER